MHQVKALCTSILSFVFTVSKLRWYAFIKLSNI